MIRAKRLQYHAKELSEIRRLNKTIRGVLQWKQDGLKDQKVLLTPTRHRYSLNIPASLIQVKQTGILLGLDLKGKMIKAKTESLVVQQGYIRSQSFNSSEAEVQRFSSEKFSSSSSYYHKLFIPLRKKLDFFYTIERCLCYSDTGYMYANGIEATLGTEKIYVGVIDDGDKRDLLVIESSEKQELKVFEEKVHRIQLALNYFVGHYPGDKGYYFFYSNRKKDAIHSFLVSEFRESAYHHFIPVQQRPASLIMTREEIEKFRVHLRPIAAKEVSELVLLLLNSAQWTCVISLMMEAASSSLTLMPGAYAIALESLVNIMPKPPKKRLLSGPDEQKFVKFCNHKLDEMIGGMSEEEVNNVDIIRRKISQLFEQPNAEKLGFPFKALGIDINKHDLEALKTRNLFLHGNIPDILKAGRDRSFTRLNSDLLYCSLRFLNLLNALILKSIGFSGYYRNYAKIQEKYTGVFLEDESYYRQL